MANASLVALGAGAAPDWPAALGVLAAASRFSPAAEQTLDLIGRMGLTPTGAPSNPPKVVPIATSPRLAIAKALFTADECAHVCALAESYLRPSVVVDSKTGTQRPHPVRTSDGAVLGPIQQDLVIHALNRRIAAVTGSTIEQGEPLTVLRYMPGQQYRPHHDCLPGEPNQRVMTAIVYLNDDFDGGATAFDVLAEPLRPMRGDALIFLNTRPDGRPDERSRHAGLPVTRGEKWIATRWIRRTRFDPWGLYG